jgi:N-acetylglucosamine-6-sulfatase
VRVAIPRRKVAIGAALLAAAVVITLFVVPRGSPERALPSGAPQAIVLILTDDQRWDSLGVMPTVQSELVSRGVTFTNGFVTDPLCCPSRASIFTGRYPHSTGVWSNRGRMGGFKVFHDGSTIATWLRSAGYHTGLFGKYLNKYVGSYVPPGWERWVAISGDEPHPNFYYDYDLNIDGQVVSRGDTSADYSTDVLAGYAESFIRQTAGPLFMVFAPHAPHLPGTPAPRDAEALGNLRPSRPPSFLEEDRSDKPEWLQSRKRINAGGVMTIDTLRRRSFASLLAVDRAVGAIVSALRDSGRLDDALIVFTSDNGFLWGEHGWVSKVVPYEESIRVPFVVRDDHVIRQARQDPHMALNIDLAPTFAAAAGVAAPGVEGRSLLPLLQGDDTGWRTDFLVESARNSHVPSYCAVRDQGYLYAVYETREEELYDLTRDPYELQNGADDPSLAEVRSRLRARVHQLCSHPPPRFTSPP